MNVALVIDVELILALESELIALVYVKRTSIIPCSTTPNELPEYSISSIFWCWIVVNSEDISKSPTGSNKSTSPLASSV